jgi:outer membrane receptor protein involved in Fe transport
VLIGRNVNLTIELPLSTAGEEYIIEETRPTLDTEQASTGQVLQKEFLQKVPSGRSYQSVVSATAGVIGGGNPNVGGAGTNENTYLLDGVQITDPVTGTFSLNFNFDAIEQIEVLTGAFDAEYPQSLGGIINIVTETGTNQLEFDTSVWYETSALMPKIDARYAADGAEIAPTGFDSTNRYTQFNAKLSGPIIRDRAWFIISYSRVNRRSTNVGIDLPRDYEGHYVMAKLTAQPNPSHRFQVLLQTDPTTIDNTEQYSRFIEPEAQGRQAQGGVLAAVTWDWFISPEIFVQTVVSYQNSYIDVTGVPCTHDQNLGYHPCQEDEPENSLDFETPARLGSNLAFDRDNFYLIYIDDRWRYRAQSKVSLLQRELLGFHDIKAGVEVDVLRFDQVVGFPGNHYYVDVNNSAYDPDTYQNYYWIEATAPFHKKQSGEHYGVFLQDVWKPVDNLTLRYGVRYDYSIQRADTQDAVINGGVLGPRFYAIWDPWGDEKTKFFGGYGRFNDLGTLGIAGGQNQSGFGYKLYFGELFGNFTSPAEQQANEYDYENTNTALDDLTAPHSDEFVIGAQREIIQDLVFGVTFTAKFTENIYTYDELNSIWDEDGYNTIGTTDGTNDVLYRMRTPYEARRDYYQTDIGLEKTFSDRWLLVATYTYTVSRGTTQNSSTAGLSVPPQYEYLYGNLSTDIRHQIKAAGAYDLPNDPWTTTLAFKVEYYSGRPTTRFYYTPDSNQLAYQLKSPLGEYARSEPVLYVDIGVMQTIHVRKGDLVANLFIYNVLNQQQADSYYSVGFGEPRWVIYSRQEPLTVSGGLQYEF